MSSVQQKYLKDENNEIFSPVVSTNSVLTSDGKRISDMLNNSIIKSRAQYRDGNGENAGMLDPDTTEYPVILTRHGNSPAGGITGGFYYIYTMFYEDPINIPDGYYAKTQIAIGYNWGSNEIWQRMYFHNATTNTKWSPWKLLTRNTYTLCNSIPDVFKYSFRDSVNGVIAIRVGCLKFGGDNASNGPMITVKGHLMSYDGSTDFEANSYWYLTSDQFFAPSCIIYNQNTLKRISWARDSQHYVWLLLRASSDSFKWSYPAVFIDKVYAQWLDYDSLELQHLWECKAVTDLSEFELIADCTVK